jgi:GNAT superfamily N-acetyltransferase
MSFVLESVSYDDPRGVELRRQMDVEMFARYATPDQPKPSAAILAALQVDTSAIVASVLAVEEDGTPIAHAALRRHDDDYEVKRVIVLGDQRGRGVGRALMAELEKVARNERASRLILQTGNKQPDAVSLYEKIGYTPIAVYEPYSAIPQSLCFEKVLTYAGTEGASE